MTERRAPVDEIRFLEVGALALGEQRAPRRPSSPSGTSLVAGPAAWSAKPRPPR